MPRSTPSHESAFHRASLVLVKDTFTPSPVTQPVPRRVADSRRKTSDHGCHGHKYCLPHSWYSNSFLRPVQWLTTDPPYRPPNLCNDDSDSSQVYVPSTVDKGPSTRASEKRMVRVMHSTALSTTETNGASKALDRDEVEPRYRTSYHVHSQVQDDSSSDSDTVSDSGSDLTPSPPSISVDARGATVVEFDGDESLHQWSRRGNTYHDHTDQNRTPPSRTPSPLPPPSLPRRQHDRPNAVLVDEDSWKELAPNARSPNMPHPTTNLPTSGLGRFLDVFRLISALAHVVKCSTVPSPTTEVFSRDSTSMKSLSVYVCLPLD
ncbi:hypothetical protein L210DRAFT_987262 [Boletus edulis BED1]|uniref:Uncharacterized protein n=1 Tax=Boletus edulis BED1 TaxID=1328754 RepID=A0AAD4G8R0_BOLED|nr:hypothetical protein L210DRAFT_987262 [Boletus edulis BED1]